MAYFAKIGLNNKVIEVLAVSDNDLLDANGNSSEELGRRFLEELTHWPIWIQCSYNTRNGIHYEPNSDTPSADQSKALRKNMPSKGYTYNEELDAFIRPKPTGSSYIFNSQTCEWDRPVVKPADYDSTKYIWVESEYLDGRNPWKLLTEEEKLRGGLL